MSKRAATSAGVVHPAGLRLDVTASTGSPFIPYLRRNLTAAHRMLRPPLRELSLVLVGDDRMSRLHEQFMGLPGPTDVLTFPLELEAGPERPKRRAVSGEVVVCVPEARRRARARGERSPQRELLLYALHGLLHLSGFDDRTESDFRTMHRTEDRLLTRLGVGPVFATAEHPGDHSAPQTERAERGKRGKRKARR